MKNKRTYPERVRAALNQAICAVAANRNMSIKNPGKDFTRTRKLPLRTMLRILIGMGGGSISKELYDWFGCSADTATVPAFTEQRDKIRPEALEIIFHQFIAAIVPTSTFQGYRVFAVDGSDLRLPANPNDTFSSISNCDNGKKYNLIHLNAMYDLLNKVYIDAMIQPKKGMNEHRALVSMVDRSELVGKVIAIMDRGYESFNNIAHFQEKSWNFIIRAKESYGIVSKLSLPNSPEYDVETSLTLTRRQTKETLALLKKYPNRYRWIRPHTTFDYIEPKASTLYDLNFRVIRFEIAEGVYETVYTNLSAMDFPPQTIKKLYHMRWGIETSFRKLKYAAGLASIHSKKKDSMLQEVFARLTFYNYTSLVVRDINVPQGKQVNFAVAVPLCRNFLKERLSAAQVLACMTRHLSPLRPGRQFKRYQNLTSAVAFQYRIS